MYKYIYIENIYIYPVFNFKNLNLSINSREFIYIILKSLEEITRELIKIEIFKNYIR